MKTTTLLRNAIAALALLVSTAHAQLFRAYLAADGSDANPCTLQAPCRLLPTALNAVASGGEIWMLDSANYNTATVNINKSVSILAVPGVVGSVIATGGPAIAIAAPGLNVALRNLVIAPVVTLPAGTSGVQMTAASNLNIENCVLANLPINGVSLSGTGTVNITDSTLRNNGGTAVSLFNGARAGIHNSQLLANGYGVSAHGYFALPTTASISDSVISEGDVGVYAVTWVPGAVSRISVIPSTITGMNQALYSRTGSSGTPEINVGSSLIFDNEYAWYQEGTGATILSLGNNQMSGNTTSFGLLTPLAPQ